MAQGGSGAAPGPPNAPLPPCTMAALVYAHLLDRAAPGFFATGGRADAFAEQLQQQDQQQTVQPLVKLARYQLELAARGAKPDELTPAARCGCACSRRSPRWPPDGGHAGLRAVAPKATPRLRGLRAPFAAPPTAAHTTLLAG